MKVLVVGSGGREHCLAWKIAQSPQVSILYCAPGNGGTAALARNVAIAASDIDALLDFAIAQKIDLTVVGPEVPLVKGIVDRFQEKGLKIFGPRKSLAQLEGSKVFSKEIMNAYGVPTADSQTFTGLDEAKEYIKKKGAPLVVKAEGLAAGKGVLVCMTIQEALDAVELILLKKEFGDAGKRIVVEDFLEGEEASILVITDGETILPLVASQDHKAAFEGDKGPNTGGMGAYAPAPVVTDEVFAKIQEKVFKPLIEGLRKDGQPYQGVLYGGLMIKNGEPSVLEFNVRFGDPETQVILPKLKNDLVEVMLATVEGRLSEIELSWDERFCLCVVLASGGYPGRYEKGKPIAGLASLADSHDIVVFHAGTRGSDADIVTSGGRVLGVVGLADTIVQTQERVYEAIKNISFEKMYFRKDIGNKALGRNSL